MPSFQQSESGQFFPHFSIGMFLLILRNGSMMPCSATPEKKMTEVVRALSRLRTDRRHRCNLRHAVPYLCTHHTPRSAAVKSQRHFSCAVCAVSVKAARSVLNAMKRAAVNSAQIPVTIAPLLFNCVLCQRDLHLRSIRPVGRAISECKTDV
jgi:hypothetical protein